jgi:hypothetical protein
MCPDFGLAPGAGREAVIAASGKSRGSGYRRGGTSSSAPTSGASRPASGVSRNADPSEPLICRRRRGAGLRKASLVLSYPRSENRIPSSPRFRRGGRPTRRPKGGAWRKPAHGSEDSEFRMQSGRLDSSDETSRPPPSTSDPTTPPMSRPGPSWRRPGKGRVLAMSQGAVGRCGPWPAGNELRSVSGESVSGRTRTAITRPAARR